MSFILVPKQGEDVQVNGWNWRPTLELIRSHGLVDEETFEKMGAQGCGGAVDGETAHKIAEVISARLSEMRPDQRMLHDLSVTAKAKSEDIQADDVYSATYDWLQVFASFCRRSGGFTVV